MESRAAKVRRHHGPRAPRPSLSTGHLEVEQDRTSHVLPHHAKLACAAPDRSLGRRRADCRDHHQTGLKVESALDTATYEKGIKVSDAEMKTLDTEGDAFHPGRVGRDIATSASRRTGRDTLASSSSHQANMPVIPSSQCTNSLRRLTAMDSINRPACIFAPL